MSAALRSANSTLRFWAGSTRHAHCGSKGMSGRQRSVSMRAGGSEAGSKRISSWGQRPRIAESAVAVRGAAREDPDGNNPEADLALTPGEIARAQAMWGWLSQENRPTEVTTALTQVGVALFTNLFRISPGLLDLFPFKNEDGTPEQEALEAHALAVMRTLGAAIAGLGDTPALVAYLKELTARHIGYGVKVEHYQILAAALMATLEGAFGKNWGAEEEAVWLRVFGLIMHAAKDSYAKAAAADGLPEDTPKYDTAEEAE